MLTALFVLYAKYDQLSSARKLIDSTGQVNVPAKSIPPGILIELNRTLEHGSYRISFLEVSRDRPDTQDRLKLTFTLTNTSSEEPIYLYGTSDFVAQSNDNVWYHPKLPVYSGSGTGYTSVEPKIYKNQTYRGTAEFEIPASATIAQLSYLGNTIDVSVSPLGD